NAAALRVPRFPRADEEVEHQIVNPARRRRHRRGEERHHAVQRGEAAVRRPFAHEHPRNQPCVGEADDDRHHDGVHEKIRAFPARRHDQQQPENDDAAIGDQENGVRRERAHLEKRFFSHVIIAALVSSGCSCCVQCPHFLISTFSRSGTKRSMPSAIAGESTTSSSAMIIRPGTCTRCSMVPLSTQLRVKLRYQLMPPVKPVFSNVSMKNCSSSLGISSSPGHRLSSDCSAWTSSRLRCSCGSLAYSAAVGPPLRMKKRKALPVSFARSASATPGFWKKTIYMFSPYMARIAMIGSTGGRGRNGVFTPMTPDTRSGW